MSGLRQTDDVTSTDIELRLGVVGDAAAIADYHLRCSIASFSALLDEGSYDTIDPRVDRFRSWLEPESHVVTTVAVLGGRPVGHVTIEDNELVHLFIDPECQGLGIGRRLLAAGERMLAAAGHRDVELHTMVGNHPAIRLYETAGWAMTDRLIHSEHDGLVYDEHVLVKRLDDIATATATPDQDGT